MRKNLVRPVRNVRRPVGIREVWPRFGKHGYVAEFARIWMKITVIEILLNYLTDLENGGDHLLLVGFPLFG